MLNNTVQCYLYFKQQQKNEFSNMFKILRPCMWVSVLFVSIEALRKTISLESEFFLSIMFFSVVILLIYYWIPNKKEYEAWKKNHATF